jgi:hypothetical protein
MHPIYEELLKAANERADRAYEEGLKRGRKERRKRELEPIAHLFERRLARPLTPAERDTLLRRHRALGATRLSDVVLDLSPDALAAWLATPDAR